MGLVTSYNCDLPRSYFVKSRAWLIWATASLFYLYEFFVRVAPAAMERDLQIAFHLTAAQLGAALGAYFYIYAPVQLVVGGILDHFGAKRVLTVAAFVCAVGCFLQVFSHASLLLVIARLCQGFGSAFAFVGAIYLATRWFPPKKLALICCLTTSLGMVGAILGNVGVAAVVDTLGWRMSLFNAGIVGLVISALLFFIIPSELPDQKADQKLTITKDAPKRLSLIREINIVIRNPQSWLAALSGTVLYIPVSTLGALWGIQYISTVTGVGTILAAEAISFLYIGWAVGGPIFGWISDRVGNRRLPLRLACVATAISTILLLLLSHVSVWQIYVICLLVGITSSPQTIAFVLSVENNPLSVSGTAIAFVNMVIMLVSGLAQPVIGWLLQRAAGHPIGPGMSFTAHDFKMALLLFPIFSVIGFIGALFLKEKTR